MVDIEWPILKAYSTGSALVGEHRIVLLYSQLVLVEQASSARNRRQAINAVAALELRRVLVLFTVGATPCPVLAPNFGPGRDALAKTPVALPVLHLLHADFGALFSRFAGTLFGAVPLTRPSPLRIDTTAIAGKSRHARSWGME